ncbi:oxidase [bacterium]|nr:oxidase [bacterium]
MSHDHAESHAGTYFAVFLALCVFTGLSVLADTMHLGNKNVLRVIVMAIAVAKAMCVLLFFMHLKFERAWKYLLLAPTLILASAIPFALMPDVGMSYYTPTAPQHLEYERMQASAEHHSEGAEHHAEGEHAPAAAEH